MKRSTPPMRNPYLLPLFRPRASLFATWFRVSVVLFSTLTVSTSGIFQKITYTIESATATEAEHDPHSVYHTGAPLGEKKT